MSETYTPKFLQRWTLPRDYMGAHWPDYYVFLGRHRDSDALTRANFDAGLKAIGGEQFESIDVLKCEWDCECHLFSIKTSTCVTCLDEPCYIDNKPDGVLIVSENHWAFGWVEWIAIHKDATDALKAADEIARKLEHYPVVDEELLSEYEETEANEVWKNCYDVKERINYIREYRNQFEFRSLADMLACVRGEYFAGYANELIYR